MESILERFANGDIDPTTPFFSPDSEYGRAFKRLYECEEIMRGMLDDEGQVLLERFAEAQSDMAAASGIERFAKGYRLGALMMMDVLSGAEG